MEGTMQDVRSAVHAIVPIMLERREVYSVDVWDAWRRHFSPASDRKTTITRIQRALREMEAAGEIVGRDVMPGEHGGSPLVRRYYRLPDPARCPSEFRTPPDDRTLLGRLPRGVEGQEPEQAGALAELPAQRGVEDHRGGELGGVAEERDEEVMHVGGRSTDRAGGVDAAR